MGRGGSSARGGGGGVVFRGNGDLGSDGTITDKQKAYAQSLFGDFDSPDDLNKFRAMEIPDVAARVGLGSMTPIGVRMPRVFGVKEKAGRAYMRPHIDGIRAWILPRCQRVGHLYS